jgi:hypothetical protein
MRLQPSLLDAVRELGEAEGVPLNQLIDAAVVRRPPRCEQRATSPAPQKGAERIWRTAPKSNSNARRVKTKQRSRTEARHVGRSEISR